MKKNILLTKMGATLKESNKDANLSFKEIQNNVITESLKRNNSLALCENISFLINGIGFSTEALTGKEIFIRLITLSPFVQKNLHLWVYGRPSFGKTFTIAKVLSPLGIVISGKITEAQLMGDLKKDSEGLIAKYSVIGFDDIQSFDLSQSEKGTLFDYLTTGETRMKTKNYSSQEETQISKRYSTSLVFNGNFLDEIELALQNQPYENPKDLLNTSFPIGCNQENFKTRVVCVPTWISRDAFLIEDDNAIGYSINFLMESFEQLKNEDVEIKLNNPLKNIRLNNNIRKTMSGIYKLLNLSQLILKEKTITTDLDMEALEFLAKKIVELPFSNSKFTLTGPQCVNQFWLKLSEHLMKYPLTSIVKAYIDEHRILLRFKEESDTLYKIALDNIGIQQNIAEVKFYENIDELYKKLLVPIYPNRKDYISVVAKTKDNPFSTYQEIKNVEDIFKKNITLVSLKDSMENSELIEYLDTLERTKNKEIEEIKTQLNQLTNFIISSFSTSERLSSKKAPLTFTEKESLTYEVIDYLSDHLSISKDFFKNYHFVLDEENREATLLHYHYLNI